MIGQLSLERLAPLAGIGFAVLLLAGRLLVRSYPDADAPAGEAVSFWSDKGDKVIAVSILGSLLFRQRHSEPRRWGVASTAAFGVTISPFSRAIW